MRVVYVSKALVVGAYRRKLEELARVPGLELTAIVPAAWQEGRTALRLERGHTAGYDLIVAPLAFNGQFHLHFYPTLGRLLHRLRPEVLHMDEEPYNLATWHALTAAARVGARSLFFTWQNLPRRYPWPFRRMEQINYRRAAYAIAGNQDAVGVLRGKGYTGPVTVIPQFGVDPELFAPGPRPEHPAFIIGYAGRLVPEKGVDVLLRACAQLNAAAWEVRLLGDGPAREDLAGLAAELGIKELVHFLGRLPSTEMVGFYRALDALVLPSVSRPNWVEQFGRVLIEAMACGVPVVGSDCGEIPHVIGDAGRVFPEGEAEALANLLDALAGDSALRQALAAAGRARALAQFTQVQIASATARVYAQMA
jgi:glycosyltransferase involved in cell wall biosynthesis